MWFNFVSCRRIQGLATSIACIVGLSASLNGEWERFESFYERVRRGENISKSDPEFMLRGWLLANCSVRSRTARPGFVLAMVIKAWNYARTKKAVVSLQIRSGEGFPVLVHPRRPANR